ncbi:uncharacterized protein G2W53_032531 [Senna tora]|uniref:Uncharacterized protein n=1 Tax=Senna tora TaxID=362788 RepID=A0A834SWK9_9FABA|nr:uncharacterized protein G2W53_032531 [Senna tora]
MCLRRESNDTNNGANCELLNSERRVKRESEKLISKLGEESIYLSSYSISNQDLDSELADVYTTEFLNIIFGSRLLYHELKLKHHHHTRPPSTTFVHSRHHRLEATADHLRKPPPTTTKAFNPQL